MSVPELLDEDRPEPAAAVDATLLAVAVLDSADPGLVAAATDLPRREVERRLAGAVAAGRLGDGRPLLTARERQCLLDAVPGSTLATVQERALDALLLDGLPVPAARALVSSGCRDPRLPVELVRRATLAAGDDDAGALLDLALAAGADPVEIAAHRAAAALATGDLDLALHEGEQVLGRLDHPAAGLALRCAAVAHAHRGMLHLSAGLYGCLGPDRLAGDTGPVAWALIGTGDADGARRLLGAAPPTPPTSLGRGLDLMARGLERSLVADGEEGLGLLLQATSTLNPVGDHLVLPDTPAAIAAIAAIGSGDLDTAETVLAHALAARLGGPLAAHRHRLLRAWVVMLRGDLDRTTQIVDETVAAGATSPRDQMLVHALHVGVARRGSDLPALAHAWAQARTAVAGQGVDLFGLLPLGELRVAAARLGEDHKLRPHLRAAEVLLSRLGQPPLWSAMHHWYGVQAAILSELPAELVAHADALAAAAPSSRFAAVLARAGAVWLQVLQSEVDPVEVRHAVGELDLVGLAWDGTRLAAQAAARTTDRKAMLDLMQLARHAQRLTVPAEHHRGPDTAETLGRSHLTDREWEVARLVLDGVGYREIGERLFISPKTVEHHVARIRRRLGVDSRARMLEVLRSLAALPDARR